MGGKKAVPWYLAGGVDIANCQGAWDALGALNQAASYVNLVNPGTNDLVLDGTGVSWSSSAGWSTNGDGFLDTGLVSATNYTVIARVKALTAGSRGPIFSANAFWFPFVTPDKAGFGYAYVTFDGKSVSDGVGALASQKGYVNGELLVSDLGKRVGDAIWLLKGYNSTFYSSTYGSLCSAAVYNVELSQAQIQAITARMMALP